MAAKRSRIGRVVQYFREADLDEAEIAFELVRRVVTERLGTRTPVTTAPKVRKQRKQRTNTTALHQTASQAVTEGESLANA